MKGQGPNAPLGRLNYMIEGAMIGGFSLVAVPAEYRVTGVKTFIIDYDGVVYQKDRGGDSLNIVKSMELYNPDKTWRPTSDSGDVGYNRILLLPSRGQSESDHVLTRRGGLSVTQRFSADRPAGKIRQSDV